MIVCEVGLNHLGDETYANHYIQKFLISKADAITFQIREERFYKNKTFSNHKLSFQYYKSVSEKIRKNKQFGFSLANNDLIEECERVGSNFYKIFSQDLNNYQLIDCVLQTKKPIYVSTGMNSINEIDQFYKKYKYPEFKDQITLIHTQLNHEITDINLNAIKLLKDRYPFKIAYGSHSKNPNVIFTSVAYNPSAIFFYIRGNKKIKHPDQIHSIQTKFLHEFVVNIHECYSALGRKEKIKMENIIDKENLL